MLSALRVLALLLALFLPGTLQQKLEQNPYIEAAPTALEQFVANKYNKPWQEVRVIKGWIEKTLKDNNVKFVTVTDVLALISIESSFRSDARGIGGQGLMQVNPTVHKAKNLNHPATNIQKGIEILAQYYTMSGKRLDLTLVFYNAGPAGAKRICGENSACKTEYVEKFHRAKLQLSRYERMGPVCLRSSSESALSV